EIDVERQVFTGVVVDVVDRALRDGLETLLLDRLAVCVADQLLDGFLLDRRAPALLHQLDRDLPLAEARQPDLPRVALDRCLLLAIHPRGGHRDRQPARPCAGLLHAYLQLCRLIGHVTPDEVQPSAKGGTRTPTGEPTRS